MGSSQSSRVCRNANISSKLCENFPDWFSSDNGFTIYFKENSAEIQWVFQMHTDGTYSVRQGGSDTIWLTPLEDNSCHFCLEGYGELHRVRVKLYPDTSSSGFAARVDIFDRASGSRISEPKTFLCA